MIRKVLFAAFAAALMLSAFAGTAAANRSLNASASRIEGLSREVIFGSAEAPGIGITCEVGLTLNLTNATFAKTARNVGTTDIALLNGGRCTGGTASVLTPRVTTIYGGFEGTLPAITGVRLTLEEVGFLIEIPAFGVRCLYRGSTVGIVNVEARGVAREVTSARTNVNLAARLTGALLCPATGQLTGVFAISNPRGGVTIRLL